MRDRQSRYEERLHPELQIAARQCDAKKGRPFSGGFFYSVRTRSPASIYRACANPPNALKSACYAEFNVSIGKTCGLAERCDRYAVYSKERRLRGVQCIRRKMCGPAEYCARCPYTRNISRSGDASRLRPVRYGSPAFRLRSFDIRRNTRLSRRRAKAVADRPPFISERVLRDVARIRTADSWSEHRRRRYDMPVTLSADSEV